MIWIFALGIIALAVFHKGFRKVVLILTGSAAAISAVVILVAVIGHHQL